VGESLAYRTLSRYLESLTVDGRIGNRLALLALKMLVTSESLIKVDMFMDGAQGFKLGGNQGLGGTVS
jgi:hypothetical protein